jgi:predicted nucleic acid-binding protein
MRTYADSSFLLKLISQEADSDLAVAEYRRLGSPRLFFLPLHALEVRNAILQRAFYQRRSLSSRDRRHIARERDSALARLEHFLARRAFLDVVLDMDAVTGRALKLSADHTESIGARAIDLLHVACALSLESEQFLTTDARQAQLANAECLKVISIAGSH